LRKAGLGTQEFRQSNPFRQSSNPYKIFRAFRGQKERAASRCKA
jgi:hypothetical protein